MPLSVNVIFIPETHRDTNGLPGSLHINRTTSESTNATGSRYHWNSLLTGDPERQYTASTMI
jgi:hypothetical protein